LTGPILAIQLLTRLPLPRVAASEADFARAIRWFPAAGLVVGLAVAAAAMLGMQAGPRIGALCALTAWIAITGALHLDGLADIADAAGAAHADPDRLYAVLRDPHVGSFGAVAIGLQLLAKLVLVERALADGLIAALLVVPCVARIGPLCWTLWLPPLHEGLASRFRAGIALPHLIAWMLALLPALWLFPALAAAPLLIGGWGLFLGRRIGGISGDGHGAGIEIVESGLLICLVLGPRIA